MRAPFQILAIPYKIINKEVVYGVLLRRKRNIWQFIAGGGENDEKPVEALIREVKEETNNIIYEDNIICLESKSTIPVVNITGEFTWGENVFVVPEYTFGINMCNNEIELSNEHKEVIWLKYEDAIEKLSFDSNKTALWELNEKLKRK